VKNITANKLINRLQQLSSSVVFKNSIWGIGANILQNVLMSIFFIIVARQYSTVDFAGYLVANSLYQLLIGFSTLGLTQWFIREIVLVNDKQDLVNRFLKMQSVFGVIFYIINVIAVYALYDSRQIHLLALLFGMNIIFDNIIYGIKALNVAGFQQKKTFKILMIESVLKFLCACLLFILPFSIITFTALLIAVRVITLNLFISIGSASSLSIKSILRANVLLKDVKALIKANWVFVFIGSITIIYWRSASLIISKMLTLADVANYEIPYKLFCIALIVPTIISSSVFPRMVNLFGSGKTEQVKKEYHKYFFYYFLFGLMAYTFMFSFSDFLVPLIFGSAYTATAIYTKQMFLTILVFPTVYLQANMLVAMKLEKYDMYISCIGMIFHLLFSIIGLYFFRELAIVNYSIFISSIICHVLQDVLLYKKNIISILHAAKYYVAGIVFIVFFLIADKYLPMHIAFYLSWIILAVAGFILLQKEKRDIISLKKPFQVTIS
jgi:O-antigen/teichoic acid export membrane protein